MFIEFFKINFYTKKKQNNKKVTIYFFIQINHKYKQKIIKSHNHSSAFFIFQKYEKQHPIFK